ncbi:MAG TPA: ABC transporter ATP-binding protein [Terriglobales bacterium]|nr:ABC transporter ATP-binding protein [Terriglobales bacterium]
MAFPTLVPHDLVHSSETIIQAIAAIALELRNNERVAPGMEGILLDSVSKIFHHRPALFNCIGEERCGETCALDRVSLEVRAGSVLALLGRNGSGKTTLLKLIATMLLPDCGRVIVAGDDTQEQAARVRKKVGFAVAAERSFFPRLTARENLDFFAAFDDVPRALRPGRVEFTLAQVGLLDAADRLVMKFSAGMYQRLGVARALVKQPSVLLLDEPTRSLDPASAAEFWRLMRELPAQGSTVVLATHSFQEATAAGDSVAILQRGKLVATRNLFRLGVAELRDFYFHATGDQDEMRTLELCGSVLDEAG